MHAGSRLHGRALCLVVALAGSASSLRAAEGPAARPAARDSLFQPADFTSLGKLVVASDQTVIFNTGSKEAEPEVSGAVSGKGAVGVSKGGKVQMAVFAFDSIELASGAKVAVAGRRALVLVSKDAIVIATTLDLSGKPGLPKVNEPGGSGGPGGEGGIREKSLDSAPPPAHGGYGGRAMKDSGEPGHGFGAGFNKRVQGGAAGSGAGYGGKGGDSSEASSARPAGPAPMPGGPAYGDEALTELFGGSGGAGGSNDRNFSSGGGAGGGGALELVSLTSITLGPDAKLLAHGGNGAVSGACGGGGSGGAILLAAPAIQLEDGAVVEARGGNGGSNPKAPAEIKPEVQRRNSGSGGGGGGGRVAFYSNAGLGTSGRNQPGRGAPKGVSIFGGKGGEAAKDGAAGSYYEGTWPGLK